MEHKPSTQAKVLVVGPAETGKTQIQRRLCKEHFQEIYIGTKEYSIHSSQHPELGLNIEFVDCTGNGASATDLKNIYHSAGVFVIVFDVTNQTTIDGAERYIQEAKSAAQKECQFLLLGNKTDMPNRAVKYEDAKKFAESHGMEYLEFSAKTSDLRELEEMILELIKRYNNKKAGKPVDTTHLREKSIPH